MEVEQPEVETMPKWDASAAVVALSASHFSSLGFFCFCVCYRAVCQFLLFAAPLFSGMLAKYLHWLLYHSPQGIGRAIQTAVGESSAVYHGPAVGAPVEHA